MATLVVVFAMADAPNGNLTYTSRTCKVIKSQISVFEQINTSETGNTYLSHTNISPVCDKLESD